MIDHIAVVSFNMKLLQELFSAGIHTRLLISTDTIMLSLMSIILVSTWSTITVPFI